MFIKRYTRQGSLLIGALLVTSTLSLPAYAQEADAATRIVPQTNGYVAATDTGEITYSGRGNTIRSSKDAFGSATSTAVLVPYTLEWFLAQPDPQKAADAYYQQVKQDVRATSTRTVGVDRKITDALVLRKSVTKELERIAKAEKEAKKEADRALGGKHSVTWFMAQPDPVKSAESHVRSLKRLQDIGQSYQGLGKQIREAELIASAVKKLVAGGTLTQAELDAIAAADAAKMKEFGDAAKYKTTKCNSTACKKAVQDAYEADVAAWQKNAIAKCGGTATRGGHGVSPPAGSNPKNFSHCTGPFPQFADYEKGGSKYPIAQDPGSDRYKTALDSWTQNAITKCGGIQATGSMTSAQHSKCAGARPELKNYLTTAGEAPKIHPDIDGGFVGGKQQFLISEASDVEKLPFWKDMTPQQQATYKADVEKMMSCGTAGNVCGTGSGSYKHSSGTYDIVYFASAGH